MGSGIGAGHSAQQWANTYGGSNEDYPHCIQQTTDGGYIVGGQTKSSGAGGSDIWLLKLDSGGSFSWTKAYGGSYDDLACSIQQTTDGGYIVGGQTKSFGAGDYDIWILKLNGSGDVSWQKSCGGSYDDNIHAIRQTSDGGYIVAGDTKSFGIGSYDIWILKLDSNGGIDWQNTYGGSAFPQSNSDESRFLQQTSDGGYIIAGHTASFDIGSYDIFLLKLDGNGDVSWTKTYGGSSEDYARSIQQTSDGGYIVVSDTKSFGAGSFNIWVLKLDGNGEVSWQKTYGGSSEDYARSIQQTADGGYIVAGDTESFGAGSSDIWVLKLDGNGGVSWQKTYGGGYNDSASYIQQISDGGYIVVGHTTSFGAGDKDFFVLKLNSNGGIPDCEIIATSNASVSDTSVESQERSATVQSTLAITDTTDVSPQDVPIQKNTVCEGAVVNTTTTTIRDTDTTTTTKTNCSAEKIYGNRSKEIELLRHFRDDVLSKTPEGREIIRLYYEWSPAIVKAMKEDEEFKKEVMAIINEILPLIGEEL